MKRQKPKRPRRNASGAGPAAASASRRKCFRLIALCLPILLLVVLELGLRLVGYGYSPAFFLPGPDGKTLLANPDFTRRFFPPGLERTLQPISLPRTKAPGTIRVFVFGESAAMGDPAPAYGFSRILNVLLEARFPGTRFEVANVATTAINSHVIREIARDCASRDGDIWLLYMGNNEVVGPYGAATVFSDQAPGLGAIRFYLALKSTRLGQWLASFGQAPPTRWEGMEMFLDQQVRQGDPSLERVYDHFGQNLEEIIRIGQEAGVGIVLSSMIVNLKDCPPFGSLPNASLDDASVAAWDRAYAAGLKLQADGVPGQALPVFEEAIELDASQAKGHYQAGLCLFALHNYPEARSAFAEALNKDTLRFRADTFLNKRMAQVAVRQSSGQLRWIDAASVVDKQYPHGITGDEFLYEHVHLNLAGNYLLARIFAEEAASLIRARPSPPAKESTEWLSEGECAARMALTDWDRAGILEEVIQRLKQPPFVGQWNADARRQRYEAELETLKDTFDTEFFGTVREQYMSAIALRPEDWVIRERYALFLQFIGQVEPALEQWALVIGRVPNHARALYHMGNSLDKLGRSQQALERFRQALEVRPEMHEAQNGLALALAGLGRNDEALDLLRDAIRRRPDFVQAHVNLGQMLASLSRLDEATAAYQAALGLQSNNVAAHINFGQLLSRRGQSAEAEVHYRAALQEDPGNAIGNFNLGNLLAGRQDPAALAHYAAAVEADPQFVEARVNWGLTLAAAGQNGGAMKQFRIATELQPAHVVAHLNLGVAYAKAGQFAQAIQAFETTLRLDPANQAAKRFLATARERIKE